MAVALARQGLASLSTSSFTPLKWSGGSGGSSVVYFPVHGARAQQQMSVMSSPPFGGRGGGGRIGGQKWSQGACYDEAVALIASAAVLPKLVVVDLDFTVWPFYCWLFQKWELFPDLSFSADSPPSVQDIFTLECCFQSTSEAIDVVDKILLSAHHWASGRIPDAGAPPVAYPQAMDIIKALAAHKVELAVASRTPAVSVAKTFLDRLAISHLFSSMEIYFTLYSKSKHFTVLAEKTGIPYSSMLFFDDETKNINVALKLGMTGVLVTQGLDLESFEKGLSAFTSKS